jgi:septum formation protein
MSELPVLKKNIVLASASPRRKQLMQLAGFSISVRPTEIEENYPTSIDTHEIAEFLAKLKADAGLNASGPGEIILAADSIVVCNGNVLEKPLDRDQAFSFLNALSGMSHLVHTGVAIYSEEKKISFTTTSEVEFARLTPVEINYYIDHYQPFDKAGGYGIQDWIGWTKIIRIHGSYANIMGLPIAEVYQALTDHF